MATDLAPGVRFETAEPPPAGPVGIATDVVGFAGVAVRGPVGTPVPIESWREFAADFGGLAGVGFLPAAVRGFFENGGRRCWIVRVASSDRDAGEAAATLDTPGGDWRLRASSPGSWGGALRVRLIIRHPAQTTLAVAEGTGDWSPARSTSGFERGMLVRLSQPGAPAIHRILSEVDAIVGRLVWVHERPELRLPGERQLTGLDPALPVLAQAVEYTLAVTERGVPVAVHTRLAPAATHPRYAPVALDEARSPVLIEERRADPSASTAVPRAVDGPLTGGRDGLALLTAADFIAAAQALHEIDEVALLAVPDVHLRPEPIPEIAPAPLTEPCCDPPPEPQPQVSAGDQPPRLSEDDVFRVQADLVERCEQRRDRMVLLEPPPEADGAAASAWRARFDSSFAALYYPWLRAMGRVLPPTGHVAGLYARMENETGVHRAPANAPLQWTDDLADAVDPDRHGRLNGIGVNVIRAAPGRGLRVLGARTMSAEAAFRFVTVRRTVIQVRRAIDQALQWTVFEPNDAMTHIKVSLALTGYLGALWQGGGLAGTRAEEAFFVRCDETLMTAADRDAGRLIAEVGVAPVAPYEFVHVRVWRVGNVLEAVDERAQPGRAAA